jgi:hypothetical protein
VEASDPNPLCIACRLNRTIPDLNDPDNGRYWGEIEAAKRRLVSQLLALGLPVKSKIAEDPERGLMFDFLRSPPGGRAVMTGHANGLITMNVEEADNVKREKIKHDLHEPYRTLLGHFRHEVGHYYWDLLVRDTKWLGPFRQVFGDERANYAQALRRNYEAGPPPDWRNSYISSYAAMHPWEDWAETWAHTCMWSTVWAPRSVSVWMPRILKPKSVRLRSKISTRRMTQTHRASWNWSTVRSK